MFYLHCSKQLLDRVSSGLSEPAGIGGNILGNWYAKAIFSKPQVALFVTVDNMKKSEQAAKSP